MVYTINILNFDSFALSDLTYNMESRQLVLITFSLRSRLSLVEGVFDLNEHCVFSFSVQPVHASSSGDEDHLTVSYTSIHTPIGSFHL